MKQHQSKPLCPCCLLASIQAWPETRHMTCESSQQSSCTARIQRKFSCPVWRNHPPSSPWSLTTRPARTQTTQLAVSNRIEAVCGFCDMCCFLHLLMLDLVRGGVRLVCRLRHAFCRCLRRLPAREQAFWSCGFCRVAVFLGMQHNLCFVPGSGTFINLLRGQRFAFALALADTEVIHLLRHAAGHHTRKLPLHFG